MDFIKLMHKATTEKKAQGKIKTAASYNTATKSFINFLIYYNHRPHINIRNINSELISQYEFYLHNIRAVTRNTSSAYLRPLKTVYNKSIKEIGYNNKKPFQRAFTGIDKTTKRAVTQHIIKRLICLDLSQKPCLQLSRDLFLFSFFTRGMAFIDIALFSHSHINNGRIVYNRHKTQTLQSIKIENPVERIIKRYACRERKYIFPIFKDNNFDPKRYDSALRLHNMHLKQLSKYLHLTIPLTSYVARHSWATQAHHMNISTKIISEALGHSKEETTRIYLASLNDNMVDNANSKILYTLKDVMSNI